MVDWPELPLDDWRDTYETLHRWTQIVASVRKRLSPYMSEWWHVALYPSATSLTTGPIPCAGGAFELELDFVTHALRCRTSAGETRAFALRPRSVSSFCGEVAEILASIGVVDAIDDAPEEIDDPVPFRDDTTHASYERGAVERWWRIMTAVDTLFRRHHSPFRGKASPVQFFSGSFDLSYVRYSGAFKSAASDSSPVAEQIDAGFWPGGRGVPGPAFYSFPLPPLEAMASATIAPAAAHWDAKQGYFLLMYDDARGYESPEAAILEFLQSSYEAAADLAGWDRATLESPPAVG
jgi:Family of unknown function (DUF5996)